VIAAEKLATQRIEESKVAAKAEGERLVAAAKASIEQKCNPRARSCESRSRRLPSAARRNPAPEVDAKAHATC